MSVKDAEKTMYIVCIDGRLIEANYSDQWSIGVGTLPTKLLAQGDAIVLDDGSTIEVAGTSEVLLEPGTIVMVGERRIIVGVGLVDLKDASGEDSLGSLELDEEGEVFGIPRPETTAETVVYGDVATPDQIAMSAALKVDVPVTYIPPVETPFKMIENGDSANDEQRKQSMQRILAFASKLDTDEADIWDLAAALTAYEILDPIVARIKSRDRMLSLLSRTSKAIELLTTLAKTFAIELDGEVVEPDADFSKWNEAKMKRLATMIWAHAEGVQRKHAIVESVNEQLAVEQERYAALEEKLAEEKKKAKAEDSIREETTAVMRQSIAFANASLAEYHEVPCFIVARVDPSTKEPQQFYRLADDKLSPVKFWNEATTYRRFVDARRLRNHVVDGLFRKAKVLDESELGKITVIQIVLRAVKSGSAVKVKE